MTAARVANLDTDTCVRLREFAAARVGWTPAQQATAPAAYELALKTMMESLYDEFMRGATTDSTRGAERADWRKAADEDDDLGF